jgi:hypothetical protein
MRRARNTRNAEGGQVAADGAGAHCGGAVGTAGLELDAPTLTLTASRVRATSAEERTASGRGPLLAFRQGIA